MSKHDFKAAYISGIDATNTDTIPDSSPTHPVDSIEPLDNSTDYLRGLAVGMRLIQRVIDWQLSSKTENQMHNRTIALAFPLCIDEWTCSGSIDQTAKVNSMNRQFLHKLVDQARVLVSDDPHTRSDKMPMSEKYKPMPRTQKKVKKAQVEMFKEVSND